MNAPGIGAALGLLLAAPSAVRAAAPDAFERTEEREPCARYAPLRQPLFGDLHVHTRFSFDAYTSGQRNEPDDAYRYARGEPISLPDPDGEPSVSARLRRPLDFAAVTDHSEYLGEIELCTQEPWSLAYWTPLCAMTRSDWFTLQLLAARRWVSVTTERSATGTRAYPCRLSDCPAHAATAWSKLRKAAERHYDRGARCRFTTFVGYEYTDTPSFYNMHRNVIFRNDRVPDLPVSTYETGSGNFPELWKRLRSDCVERGDGCDAISIPHNSNLAGGLMFRDPTDDLEARERLFFEPLVELIQHKAASECRFDRLAGRGVGTEDELCTFEQNRTDNLGSLGVFEGEMQAETGGPVSIEDFAPRNLLRNVLKDGLALGARDGLNPFRMGFIGSTDTHNATPGGTLEDAYTGHLGRRDAGFRNVQDHYEDNPGGLAVVWAEENSRDSIFAAMRRRETYATSGTRPVLRFFAGENLDPDLCAAPDRVERAYLDGVPMGGELQAPERLRLLVSVLKDPGTAEHPGTDLERVQVIKGWVDADGVTRERVIDVARSADSSAEVDPLTCAPRGRGAGQLCAVWEDPDYDPARPAFYYARVLENPTCRWSTRQCLAAGVSPFDPECPGRAAAANAAAHETGARGDVWSNCCLGEEDQPFLSPLIQERAWSSPIWIHPAP